MQRHYGSICSFIYKEQIPVFPRVWRLNNCVFICNINAQLLKNHQHKSLIKANEKNVLKPQVREGNKKTNMILSNIVSFLIFLWLLSLHQVYSSSNSKPDKVTGKV